MACPHDRSDHLHQNRSQVLKVHSRCVLRLHGVRVSMETNHQMLQRQGLPEEMERGWKEWQVGLALYFRIPRLLFADMT